MRNGQGFAAIDRPAAEHQAAHEDRKQQVTGDAAQNRNEDQHYVQDNRDNDDQDPWTHGGYEQTPAFTQPCDAPADIDGTRVNGWRGRERPGRGCKLVCHVFFLRRAGWGDKENLSTATVGCCSRIRPHLSTTKPRESLSGCVSIGPDAHEGLDFPSL